MKYGTILIALALVAGVTASCPNGCSGNGKCGSYDRCECHQNWQGADCSQRTCPFTLAWVDTARGHNDAHYYAECGNKGVCDRKTGECKCFEGYEGKGCRRSSCPEGCSGHGTCEYIEELGQDFHDRRNGPAYDTSGISEANLLTTSTRKSTLNYNYDSWDTQKVQGCKCDLGYSGADCSARDVPQGDDPLTTDQAQAQEQYVVVGNPSQNNWGGSETFYAVYHDPYGGQWRTTSVNVATATGSANVVDRAATASNLQTALRALPNKVLDNVQVAAESGNSPTVCKRSADGDQESTCTYATHTTNAGQFVGKVTFANKPGQTGVQYLLEIVTADENNNGAGYFPASAGTGATHNYGYALEKLTSGTSNGKASGEDTLSELSPCSNRGLDDGEGGCECFEGYRGLACEFQEALV